MGYIGWQFIDVFWRRTLLDGSRHSGLLMRRRVNGKWQYRLPTKDEENHWCDGLPW